MLQQHQKNKLRETKYNGTAPALFLLPLADYEDEMMKNRNRKMYLKLQYLEKELNNAKEYLKTISSEHVKRMKTCRELITLSQIAIIKR